MLTWLLVTVHVIRTFVDPETIMKCDKVQSLSIATYYTVAFVITFSVDSCTSCPLDCSYLFILNLHDDFYESNSGRKEMTEKLPVKTMTVICEF